MNLQPLLNPLVNADLIQLAASEPELAYIFRHALIQDAAYSTLLRGQRQKWHQVTAEVLESVYVAQGSPVELAPILANHFSLAGDRPRALRYLRSAGDAAFGNYANTEAANFYRQALDLAVAPGAAYDTALVRDLSSRYGRALELNSRFGTALDHYRTMEAAARQRGDQPLELACVMARATIHSTANMAQDLPHAMQLLERASALAHDLGDAEAEANIKWTLLLNTSMGGGDVAQSRRYGEEALALAQASGQRSLTALIHQDLWFVHASLGEWEQARATAAVGLQLGRELGNLTIVIECLLRISMSDMVMGHYDDSLATMAQGLSSAEAANSDDMRALSRLTGGVIHHDRGDFDRAIETDEQGVRLAETTDNVTVLIGTRSDLGRIYGLLGDVERGLALALRAEADGSRFPVIRPMASTAVARLHLLTGDVAAAQAKLAALPDYHELASRVGFLPPMFCNLGLAGVELALARGEAARAAELACELISLFDRTGVIYARPEARLLHGQALMALNRPDEAWDALQMARAEAQALNARRLLWPINEALADLADRRDPAQAGDLRRQAREMLDYLIAHVPTPELRQRFLQQAAVQHTLRAGG